MVIIIANESIKLISFPDSDIQALAILYTQNQDLKGKSVKEVAKIYYDAYYELAYDTKDLRNESRKKFKNDFQ